MSRIFDFLKGKRPESEPGVLCLYDPNKTCTCHLQDPEIRNTALTELRKKHILSVTSYLFGDPTVADSYDIDRRRLCPKHPPQTKAQIVYQDEQEAIYQRKLKQWTSNEISYETLREYIPEQGPFDRFCSMLRRRF